MKAKWVWLLLTLLCAATLLLVQACALGDDDDDDDDDLDIDDDAGDDDDDDAADDDDDDVADDDDDDDDDATGDDDTGDDDTGDDDTGDDDTGDDDTGDDDTGDDDTGDDDTGDDDTGDDDTSVDETIYDVQNGTIPEGTTVTLADVVVTVGIDLEEKGFWIQEPVAKDKEYEHAYSGVYVFLDLTVDQKVTVSRGDVVTVTGVTDEFNKMTEIKVTDESDVTVTGSGATLPSFYTDTTDFFGGWETEDPEPYEGVLIEVVDVEVTLNAGSGVYWIAQAAKLDAGNVRVDDWYYDLAATVGDVYTYIRGPLYQGSDSGGHVNYRLQPRDASDVSVSSR